MIEIDLDKISKNELATILVEKDKEIERLHSIIKEVREYIKDNVVVYAFNNKDLPHWEFNDDNVKELLEILEKESDKE